MHARIPPASIFFVSLACLVCLNTGAAQEPPIAPTLNPGDKAEVLFVASAPDSAKDAGGKPALASLEPIAFMVGTDLRDCTTAHPAPGEDTVPKATLQTLTRAYSKGRQYPLWSGGSPWGEAEAVSSCIGNDYLDLNGCFRLHPDDAHRPAGSDFEGTVWTGKAVVASHPAMRAKADAKDRRVFLSAASTAFAVRHVRIAPSSIHSGDIWETQLRDGHSALAGSTLVQIATAKAKTFYSYRMFLVIEEDKSNYSPVLIHFHRATITLDDGEEAPRTGEILDEENDADKEVFLDNFPLYAEEPDAIITLHSYYEDWNYSIYRRRGTEYRLIYTGCGGGT